MSDIKDINGGFDFNLEIPDEADDKFRVILKMNTYLLGRRKLSATSS